MRFTAWVPAAEHERFAPGSWDAQIGSSTRLQCFGTDVGWAKILQADIAADGSGVTLTFDAELNQPDLVT
jgi:hypothetical protein